MNLGDLFPEELKKNNSKKELKIGTVLRLHVKDTDPPKIKRFIIIGFTEDKVTLATVYINTEINTNVNWSIEQQDLQLSLSSENREYLEHDSFVDCSKFFLKGVQEITDIVKSRPEVIIGELNQDDLKIVIEKIKNATTIKGKVKKKYGLFDN